MITYTDPTQLSPYIGVWVDGKPAGRIRGPGAGGDAYQAFTNKRAPGEGSYLGTFRTQDQAGAAVAEARERLS